MRHYVLGKHGWSAAGMCVLLPICVAAPAQAAPASQGKIAIGSPTPGSLVAGRITMSVAYDTGFNRISSFTVLVDDQIHSSREFIGMKNRGIYYIDLDTRSLQDGNHTVKIIAKGTRGVLSLDQVNITVRNGVNGGADLVPPLVQFRNLTEGSVVRGKVSIDILAEDNTTQDLLVSIFVNQFPRLIKSRPPYTLDLNTSEFLDPATGVGKITLEAWAYDKFNNLGKAKPITIRVEPEGASENQTKAPAGALTRPMDMNHEPALPAPLRATVSEALIMPVPGMRGEMPPGRVDPRLPSTARAGMTGKPVISRNATVPGTRPTQPRLAKAVPLEVDPEFAPVGSASRQGLAGGKTSVPYLRPRTGYEDNEKRVGSLSVEPARAVDSGGTAAGGVRASTPPAIARPERVKPEAVKPVTPPAARPTAPGRQMAKAAPLATPKLPGATVRVPLPAPRPAAVRPPAPAARAADPLTIARAATPVRPVVDPAVNAPSAPPEAVDMMPMGNTIPAPQAAPRPSQGGPRAVMPPAVRPVKPAVKVVAAAKPAPTQSKVRRQTGAVKPIRMAKAAPLPAARPKPAAPRVEPIFVVVDKGAEKNGKVSAEVFRLSEVAPKQPTDRSYQVKRGDTLDAVAKKFKVTPKAIMVANGITSPNRLRAGSVIKVPGTFDLVLNDQRVAFDVSPRIENGLPLAPFRQIFEHAGGVVVWNPESQEVRAANDSKDVKLKIGSKEAVVNQVVVVMDREAFLDSGRTIVPISFMEKALDLKAEYDVKNGTIMLVKR